MRVKVRVRARSEFARAAGCAPRHAAHPRAHALAHVGGGHPVEQHSPARGAREPVGPRYRVRTARPRLVRVARTYSTQEADARGLHVLAGVCVSAWAGTRHSAARAGRRAPPRPRGTTARRHCRQCTSPAAAPLLRGGSRCLPAACPRDSWAGARALVGIGSRRRRRRADGRRPPVRRALAAERGAPSFAGGGTEKAGFGADNAVPRGRAPPTAREVRTVRNLTAPTPLSKTQHDPTSANSTRINSFREDNQRAPM